MNRWPMYQPIQNDELLSSWLLRNALAHGCAPLAFCGALWPGARLWTKDLDCGLDERFLRQFDSADFPGVALSANRFKSAIKTLSGVDVRHANTRWLLSLGMRNRRHSCGPQYCPMCFAEEIPYLRFQGRYAWHTGCPIHGCSLSSRCPRCHAPVQLHLLVPPAINCSTCHACGAILGSVSELEPCLPDALVLQSMADNQLYGRSDSAQEWFEYAYLLVSLLRYALRSHSVPTLNLLSQLGVELGSGYKVSSGLPLELLEVSERMQLMAWLAPLVAHSPDQVAQVIARHRLPVSMFGRNCKKTAIGTMAGVLCSAAATPAHKASPTDRHWHSNRKTVVREWARLQRKIFAYVHS